MPFKKIYQGIPCKIYITHMKRSIWVWEKQFQQKFPANVSVLRISSHIICFQNVLQIGISNQPKIICLNREYKFSATAKFCRNSSTITLLLPNGYAE